MRTGMLCFAFALAVGPSLLSGQRATPPKPASAKATGTFLGRSGKPMAGAKVMIATVAGDQDFERARIRIVSGVDAVTDAQGRFELKGFAPGDYAWLYHPSAAAAPVLRADADIKALSAVEKSLVPLLKNYEIGADAKKPFADRVWGRAFTLLKGHTFMSRGEFMKIWNATARRNPSGPYFEIRKGAVWIETLADKTNLKLDAWSY